MNVRLVSITEANLDRILRGVHHDHGYVVLSAYRSWEAEHGGKPTPEQEAEQLQINLQNDAKLRQVLRTAYRFSFIPVHGGYIESTPDAKKIEVTEPSYIIFGSDRTGRAADPAELREFGRALANRFGQDSFLWKAPGENGAQFVGKDDEPQADFKSYSVNDLAEPYFTRLKGPPDSAPLKPGRQSKGDARWSWRESQEYQLHREPAKGAKFCYFVHDSPKSHIEAQLRGGEIFLKHWLD